MQNEFSEFRKNIKKCKECNFKNKHSEPLFFNCLTPEKVKYLVITEQPKEDNNCGINEDSVKHDLQKQLADNKGSTRGLLIDIFDKSFADSIINESGYYYWTHHTKCPSQKREYKEKCITKWFKKEIDIFPNITHIISFGTKPYRGIVNISKNLVGYNFYDYFWKEIEIIIKDTISSEKLEININDRTYIFVALPHPSSANPLSNLLNKFDTLITWIKKDII